MQTLPDWQAYAIYTKGGSDKFYSITVNMNDDGTVTEVRRWGRNPDNGGGQQTKVTHPSIAIGTAVAKAQMNEKIGKGYIPVTPPVRGRVSERVA